MNESGDMPFDLSPDDRRVLDEFVEAGFDDRALRSLPDVDQQRADRINDLLSLLHEYPVDGPDDQLVERTLACVERSRHVEAPSALSPNDARLLDQLADSNFDPDLLEQLSPAEREHADRMMTLLGLMHDYPVEDGDETLIHATLVNIDRYEDERAARLSFEAHRDRVAPSSSRRLRLPDFISVAAVLLICASILWPIIGSLQKERMAINRERNLSYVSHAVTQYANDYGGTIPVAQAGLASMWNTSTETVNLSPLVEQNYMRLRDAGGNGPSQRQIDAFKRNNIILFVGDRNPIREAIERGRLDGQLRITLGHDRMQRDLLTPNGAILWLHRVSIPPAERDPSLWSPERVRSLHDDIVPKDERTD
jgi:hypothetical protein